MVVLRGILLVLKWIGILLLILLGLVLLILLLALLAPVRYKGKVKKEEVPENAVSADGLIAWLNPLVRIRIRFSEKKLSYTVRVFGICLLDSEKTKKDKKPKKVKKSKKAKKAKKKGKNSGEKKESPITVTLDESKKSEKPEAGKPLLTEKPETESSEAVIQSEVCEESKKSSFFEKIKAWIEKIKAIPEKIKEKILRMRKQLELLWKKKEAVVVFWQDKLHMLVVGKTIKAVKELLLHSLPRKLKGYVEFGTGDPESTGKALAVFGILYAAHGKHLTIVPDFNEKKVVADVFFRGRIRLGTVLWMIWRFIRDKQVKAFYKDWKRFVRVLKQKAE